MAVYVLVHGGGHGGWCYKHVARQLKSGGHDVYCPTLTGLGERSHLLRTDTGLETHIIDVVNMLVYEDLREVILVGHSYAGMVITGVADRALTRIAQLVYLDAPVPMNGESLVDLTPEVMAGAREAGRVVNGVELVAFPGSSFPGSASLNFFGVTDPDDIAWMKGKLEPHPWKSFEDRLRLIDEKAVRSIPRTMINCTPTLHWNIHAHEERQLDGDRVWEIDTGHDLMITEPVAVAEMLGRLA